MLPRIVSKRLIEKGTRKCKRDNRCLDHRTKRQVTFFFFFCYLVSSKRKVMQKEVRRQEFSLSLFDLESAKEPKRLEEKQSLQRGIDEK